MIRVIFRTVLCWIWNHIRQFLYRYIPLGLYRNMGTKCVFCGANAGKQNTPLQQHRPRCRWIGPANTYFMSHPDYYKMIAEDPQVERVLANGAIKQALCREVKGDRAWLGKIRVVPGHNYHLHIRIKCPADSPDCVPDVPPPTHDDCTENLAFWRAHNHFKPTPGPTGPPGYQLKLADLPPMCREVLIAPRAGAAKPE